MRPLRWAVLMLVLFIGLAGASARTTSADPAWQVSAPRDGAWRYSTVELGLRNKWGGYGECYWIVVEVYDPWGDYAQGGDGWVCSDEWTYWYFEASYYRGWYRVYYYFDGWVIAEDRFWLW